jgi:hypothetical protein
MATAGELRANLASATEPLTAHEQACLDEVVAKFAARVCGRRIVCSLVAYKLLSARDMEWACPHGRADDQPIAM